MEINNEIITHVENFIEKTRNLHDVKFRFIFGRYSTHFGFEPHIFQKEKYDEIKLFLESCVSWETEHEIEEKNENQTKNETYNLILSTNGSYDLMVTNSLDVNISGIRKIVSFKRKNHRFVLSTITNELNQIYYTFEIIAYVQLNYTSKYISDSSLLKVRDIIIKINPDLELNFEIIK